MARSFAIRIMFGLVTAAVSASVMLAAQRGNERSPDRQAVPTGPEIAAAARAAMLDPANAGTATMFGKPFRFTPARHRENTEASLERGAFVGVLENGAAGDETGLPPGKYNIFVAKVAGQWKTYAEAVGQIVKEAISTTMTPGASKSQTSKPTFSEKGWCVYYVHFISGWGGKFCF